MMLLKKLAASWLIVFVVVAPGLAACSTTQLPADRQERIEELHAMDPEGEDPEIQAQIDQEIADGAVENASWLFQLLEPIPVLGPVAKSLGPLGVAALAPVFFKRPRQNLGKALGGLNPWNQSKTPWDAVKGILAAYGLLHSSPASAEVVEAELDAEKAATKAAKAS